MFDGKRVEVSAELAALARSLGFKEHEIEDPGTVDNPANLARRVERMDRERREVGRFASRELLEDGERSVLSLTTGQHWRRIEVRLTVADFCNPRVIEWLQRLPTRVDDANNISVTIRIQSIAELPAALDAAQRAQPLEHSTR